MVLYSKCILESTWLLQKYETKEICIINPHIVTTNNSFKLKNNLVYN